MTGDETRDVTLEAIEIRQLALELRRPMVAAHGTTTRRDLVVVRVSTADGREGWGECAALAAPTYSSEFAEGALVVIRDHLAPRLLAGPLDPDHVAAATNDIVGHPMAKAAVEMAVIDAHLRTVGIPLAAALGAEASTVPQGGTVGEADLDDLLDQVGALVEAGARRVKLKIRPGHDVPVVATIAAAFPDLELHGDANGSYGADQVRRVIHTIEAGLRAVEQPFAPSELGAAAELVSADIGAHVLADEAATSPDAIELLARRGAATGVVIKPGRLGGLGGTIETLDRATGLGLAVAVGGMIESGLGRHALAAVAALPGVDVIGDLSPARQWLVSDPFVDLAVDASGDVVVPVAVGVAPPPDPTALEALSTVVSTVRPA